MEQAKEGLNSELKKYFEDVSKTISGKVAKVSSGALIPAYMERFSLDELKQLVAFFESPAVKKYQASAPELGNGGMIEIILANGRRIRADTSTDPVKLARLVAALDGAA